MTNKTIDCIEFLQVQHRLEYDKENITKIDDQVIENNDQAFAFAERLGWFYDDWDRYVWVKRDWGWFPSFRASSSHRGTCR